MELALAKMIQFAYLEFECMLVKRWDLVEHVYHYIPGAIIMAGHKYWFNELKGSKAGRIVLLTLKCIQRYLFWPTHLFPGEKEPITRQCCFRH